MGLTGTALAAKMPAVARPKSDVPTEQIGVRMSKQLLERIDRHLERMRGQIAGMEFTRADAVRALVTERLDEIEAAESKTPKPKK